MTGPTTDRWQTSARRKVRRLGRYGKDALAATTAAARAARGKRRRWPVILMYHRVASPGLDPWDLSVSPAHFDDQLAVLRASGRPVVRLEELVRGLEDGMDVTGSVVVSFDDGYADNVEHALPALERHEIPATFFVTTGTVGSDREMWWDELERLVLTPGQLPTSLDCRITGEQVHVDLAPETADERGLVDADWRAWDFGPTGRKALFLDLWRRIGAVDQTERLAVLDQLATWAGVATGARASHRMMDLDELGTLASSGLTDIGSHTVTHPDMRALSADQLDAELRQSRAALEEWSRRAVRSFAFPTGFHSDAARAAVRQAGYDVAVSTEAKAVPPKPDPYLLPRFHAPDLDGDGFDRLLAGLG
jgi:peptidoglycan/xylan/chitin deacetylase (PgdA/CDA1 family)